MYFDFEDFRPDTPTIASPLSTREGVLLSIIVHLVIVIAILVGPELPFMKALEAKRQQQLEEIRQREMERLRENARFVFIQPKVDIQALQAPPRAELSDIDRQARTIERAPNPRNTMPFSRGNTTERIVADAPLDPRRESQPAPSAAQPDAAASARSLPLADAPEAEPRPPEQERQPRNHGPALGVLSEAIRNVQKYTEKEGFRNLEGGANQEFSESIQFDSKGVDFGPWLRRFVAQVRRNWLVPYAAATMRGTVVLTFTIHKDGRITDLTIAIPSSVDGFTHAAFNAIKMSNPTYPLPPEFPDAVAPFKVMFCYNESRCAL